MQKSLKIVGTVATLGALATIALVNIDSEGVPTFLAGKADGEVITAFNKYISEEGKYYITRAEYGERLSQFRSAYEFVKNHDAKKEGMTVKLNQFSDRTPEEIARMGIKPKHIE